MTFDFKGFGFRLWGFRMSGSGSSERLESRSPFTSSIGFRVQALGRKSSIEGFQKFPNRSS